MIEIILADGSLVQVSNEDADLKRYAWVDNGCGYAYRSVRPFRVYLHHIIALRKGLRILGLQVDHKDRNSRNCQRDNIRVATASNNRFNRDSSSVNTSGYRGVYWCKNERRWKAVITKKRERCHLGYYDDIAEAALAYIVAAKRLYGDFAEFLETQSNRSKV